MPLQLPATSRRDGPFRSSPCMHRDSMRNQRLRPRRSRNAQILSTVLFIAALGFAGAAAWIWYTEDDSDGPGTPPPAQTSGEVDLAQVLMVLNDPDGDWDYGRSPAAAHTDQMSPPGQHLKQGDHSLFVFIFPGPTGVSDREAASAQIDLDSMVIATRSGTVMNDDGEQLHMSEHGNVITILVGGDQALNDRISASLANLP